MASQQLTEKNRRKRQQRSKAASASTTSADEANHLDETGGKAANKQYNKKFPHDAESVLSQQIENAGATTPPRQKAKNHTVQDGKALNGQQSNRKKSNYSGDANTATPGVKKAKNGAITTTPNKPVIEMAYAGPTFHASPAPSALPVPKFLSKSAPPVEPTEGINARLQQEDSSSSSEQSPDSPTRQAYAKASTTGNIAPAPALFNMLINADREEKARQRVSQSPAPAHENNGRSGHNRTMTAGSVFPMDMDASSGRSTPASASHQQSNPQLHRQASPAHHHHHHHQSQHRQSYASPDDGNLKRMLFSSPSQGTSGSQATYPYGSPSQNLNGWNSSPASRSNNSPYGTPPSTSSANGLAASSRPAPASPYTQASASPAARRSLYAAPNNSGLRQELSAAQTLHLSPPSHNGNPNAANHSPLGSPIAQRFPNGALNNINGNYFPYGSHGNNSPARNHSPAYYGTPPSSKFGPQDALKASFGQDQHALSTASMEDALRKVLRLDPLRAAATAAPPS